MKKSPMVVVAVILFLSVLLGVMMFSVGGADEDSILDAYNNISSTFKRPISVEQVMRLVEPEQSEIEESAVDENGNPITTTIPGSGGTVKEGTNPEEPPTSTFTGGRVVSGTLQYIPQGSWWGNKYMDISSLKLGGNGKPVSSSGCYFCSLSMVAAFYRGKVVTAQEAAKVCNNSSNFDGNMAKGNNVLSDYGASVSVSGDTKMSLDSVKASINSNKPLIIHFTGRTVNDYYTGSGHFAFCVGYSDSDQALVLYDPGKGPASAGKKLTYDEYTRSMQDSRVYMRSFN